MRFRERDEEERARAPRLNGPGGPDDAGGEDLERLRAVGEDFLAAGDEAIRRALSGDSERFLRANRQRGGQ